MDPKVKVEKLVTMLMNILQENINFRKLTLVGSKMKIYQERMRMTCFLEVVANIKNDDGVYYQEKSERAI